MVTAFRREEPGWRVSGPDLALGNYGEYSVPMLILLAVTLTLVLTLTSGTVDERRGTAPVRSRARDAHGMGRHVTSTLVARSALISLLWRG